MACIAIPDFAEESLIKVTYSSLNFLSISSNIAKKIPSTSFLDAEVDSSV